MAKAVADISVAMGGADARDSVAVLDTAVLHMVSIHHRVLRKGIGKLGSISTAVADREAIHRCDCSR